MSAQLHADDACLVPGMEALDKCLLRTKREASCSLSSRR